jgi:hypothetical protein
LTFEEVEDISFENCQEYVKNGLYTNYQNIKFVMNNKEEIKIDSRDMTNTNEFFIFVIEKFLALKGNQ